MHIRTTSQQRLIDRNYKMVIVSSVCSVYSLFSVCVCVWLCDKSIVCDEDMWADNEGPLYLLVERREEDSVLD